MDLYERHNKGLREIATTGHIDPVEFIEEVERQQCHKINLGDVKQIYEAMRYRGKNIDYVKCSKNTPGAYAITIGIING